MAQDQDSQGAHSAGEIVELGDCDSSKVGLPLLPTNEDLPVDEVIFINPLTPPLPPLPTLEPERLVRVESDVAGQHGTSLDPNMKQEKEDLPWVSKAVPAQNVRIPTHECSLCDKVFGTASALNKHLLSHQQDRPHICPICQRAFKRHDHLTGHMMTHQKRKPFRCLEPGCQKSYCDGYALKRHCASQHRIFPMPPPLSSSSVHTAPGLWGDCVAGHTDYHSIFLSPPNPPPNALHKCADYAGFSGYTGFASSSGVGVSSFQEPSASQVQSLSALDPWGHGEAKELCGENVGEPCTSQGMSGTTQWVPSLEPDINTFSAGSSGVRSPGARVGSLGPHCWESGLDFPVSELQALEEMLSFQSSREVLCSRAACSMEPASPEALALSAPRRPSIVIKQALCQVDHQSKPQLQPQSHSFSSLKSSICLKPTAAAEPTRMLGSSELSRPSPEQPIRQSQSPVASFRSKPPGQRAAENRKKKARKRKVKDPELPAPALLPPLSTAVAAHRRQRPRPLYLVSPSQVAMASFSTDSTPCQPLKGGKHAVFCDDGNGGKADDRGHHGPEPAESSGSQPWPVTDPGNLLVKVEQPFLSNAQMQQGEKGEASFGQWRDSLEAPCADDQRPLSPLVIPVSVPVTEKTEIDPAHLDEEHAHYPALFAEETVQRNAWFSKRAHRFEFLKTLFIPPPAPPQTPPPRVFEEGVGGQWCRAAGGYPSHLRSPMYLADHLLNPSFQPPPYTPPPMLSPLRPGTGLYLNTLPLPHPGPPPPSTYTATLDVADGISLVMDDTVVTIEPRINVGSRFQAEIPALCSLLPAVNDEHPAQLVWAPWGDIATNPKTQQRVSELLDLCCSSVLPGGGTNTELALHCLHKVQGNILAALDLLLIRGDYFTSHSMGDYHYSGSDHWSPREKRLFHRALLIHNKDFQLIHSMLQSKSVAQCVEYYYAMKKLKKFKMRNRVAQSKEEESSSSMIESPGGPETSLVGKGGSRKGSTKQRGAQDGPTVTAGALEYTCEECGRSFEKVKSRSAHMKTHRQQEREWPAQGSFLDGEYKEEAGQRSGAEVRWRPFHF